MFFIPVALSLSFTVQMPLTPPDITVPLPLRMKQLTEWERVVSGLTYCDSSDASSKAVQPLLPGPITSGPNVVGLPSAGSPASGGVDKSTTTAFAARHVFDSPASFERPWFGQKGNYLPTEGVVIYEGMELLVQKDGSYELAYTALIPEQPVTIRLQLTLNQCGGSIPSRKKDGLGCDDPVQQITLTLPPVRLEPRKTDDSGLSTVTDPNPGPANIFRVTQKGYSHRLGELLVQTADGNAKALDTPFCKVANLRAMSISVSRAGSVRFERIEQGLFNNYSTSP